MEREHAFRETVKMYKTHITQWGLDKKNKEFEMRAIVRKNKQRSDRGKRSVIHVRGQLRDFAETVRYWDRKGVSIDEVIARHTKSPTPEAVVFSTPIPSPIMTPQVCAIPEHIFLYVRNYSQGSFGSGTWIMTEPISLCYTKMDTARTGRELEVFRSYCNLAFSLLQVEQFRDAARASSTAIARIKKILLAEDPLILLRLLGVLSLSCEHNRYEISLAILRHFSAVGKILLGSQHPLCRIAEWCPWVFNSNFDTVVTRSVEIATDQFESSLGPLHFSTLCTRINIIQTKIATGIADIHMLRELVENCEKVRQPIDIQVVSVRGVLAQDLYNQGHFREAEAEYQHYIAYTQNFPIFNDFEHGEDHDLHGLAMCQYALGKVDLGIATLHKLIDMGISQ